MRGKTNPFPSFEYALLGLLNKGPAHGYELHKHLKNTGGIGLLWGIKISNLYALLSKLEKSGFIEGEVQPGEDRPARTEFHLTEVGRKEFFDWLTRMVEHPREFRQEFMLRYYFLSQFKPEVLHETCLNQLVQCQQWLTFTRQNQEKLSERTFPFALAEFRASQIKSMTEWLEWLIAHPPIIKSQEE